MTSFDGYDNPEEFIEPSGRHARRDIESDLRELIELVSNAKQMPLSNSALVPREDVLGLLEQALRSLPEEIREARWALRDREELMAAETQKAQQLMDQVRAEAARMVDKTEIVRQSRLRAEQIIAEAQAQVAELLKASTTGDEIPVLPPQLLLKRTSQAGIDPLGGLSYPTTSSINAPFASIEVKMVPENVTDAAMTPAPPDSRERLAVLRHGEAFEDLLQANGASKDAADAILAAFGVKRGESPVAEGQKVLLQYDDSGDGKPPLIARVSVYADEQLKSTIAINDEGAYVPVTLPRQASARGDSEPDNGGLSLYESMYETALKQGLPKPIIDEMVRAFANDVDFQRATQPGDSITAFIAEPDEIDPHPQLLYASMSVRDQTFKYFRFQTPDDGLVDFYDENGRSVRKFLLRKPVAGGEMTSPFGMRYHPILHYTRMHTGVDWGAPIGTPVVAAGNGAVIKAEFTSGYGRRIEIQHVNGYVTTYSHLSGFARGIAPGVRVTQGQVIGYLGQSGLATGPHLHYEVIINGNFVDPMGIKLARTREFDGKLLAAFKRERDRIEQLMAEAPTAASTASAAPTAPAGATTPGASTTTKIN